MDGVQRAQDSPGRAQFAAASKVIVPGCGSRGFRGSWGDPMPPTRRVFRFSFALMQLLGLSVTFQLLLLLRFEFFLVRSLLRARGTVGPPGISLAFRGRAVARGRPGLPAPRQSLGNGGEEAVQRRLQAGGVEIELRAQAGRRGVAFGGDTRALRTPASLLGFLSLPVLLRPGEEAT